VPPHVPHAVHQRLADPTRILPLVPARSLDRRSSASHLKTSKELKLNRYCTVVVVVLLLNFTLFL
jgi:hypothetical protein